MEDQKIADELVKRDLKNHARGMRELGIPIQPLSFEDQSDWPEGDGQGVCGPCTIGVRGHLTKREARRGAAMWREARRRYPKAMFMIHFLGFDEDPREIWDIPEAARYVRWWARFAGLADQTEAERYIADEDARFPALNGKTTAAHNVLFLAGCGVYGGELKAHALRNMSPVRAN